MSEPVSTESTGDKRPEIRHVRLRTLILIRWVAVSGQLVSILLVQYLLAFPLPLGPLLGAIALSAAINFLATFLRPSDARLSDGGAALFLGYDVIQLAFLIALTGGLENPFAILFLVPAAISATILSLRSTVAITALVIICVTLVAFLHRPLPWLGEALSLPPLYLLAVWAALMLGTLFITAYAWRVANEARRMANALAPHKWRCRGNKAYLPWGRWPPPPHTSLAHRLPPSPWCRANWSATCPATAPTWKTPSFWLVRSAAAEKFSAA